MSINFLRNGTNTKDATASASNITLNKTAYVNEEKLVGTLKFSSIVKTASELPATSDDVGNYAIIDNLDKPYPDRPTGFDYYCIFMNLNDNEIYLIQFNNPDTPGKVFLQNGDKSDSSKIAFWGKSTYNPRIDVAVYKLIEDEWSLLSNTYYYERTFIINKNVSYYEGNFQFMTLDGFSVPGNTVWLDTTINGILLPELYKNENGEWHKALINTANMSNDSTKLLTGYTMCGKNNVVNGAMVDNGELNYTPSNQEQNIPEGYTSGGSIVGDENLVANNIKKDVSIFGVIGTYEGTTSNKRKLSELHVGDIITKVKTKNCIPLFSPTLGIGEQLIIDSINDTHVIELNAITTEADYDTLDVTIFEDTNTVLYKYFNNVWSRETVDEVTLTSPITVGTITDNQDYIAGLDDVLEFEIQ